MLSQHKDDVKKRPKADSGLSKSGSRTMLKETVIFVPVGSDMLEQRLLASPNSRVHD